MAISVNDREQFAALMEAFSRHVKSDYVKAHLQNALTSFTAETKTLDQVSPDRSSSDLSRHKPPSWG